MPSIKKIIKQINQEYPDIIIRSDKQFFWSPNEKTVYYNQNDKQKTILLLHELSHAILNHQEYQKDIQLLKMERQAWDYTKKLAKQFKIIIPEEIVQENLDTYRQWLHERSLCPKCSNNGSQIDTKTYKCPVCLNQWQVNQAINCSLKRYLI